MALKIFWVEVRWGRYRIVARSERKNTLASTTPLILPRRASITQAQEGHHIPSTLRVISSARFSYVPDGDEREL
jgi:hypothetical protein